MAAAGVGVAFVDELSARAHRSEGLIFKQLPQAPDFPILCVTNVHRPRSALDRTLLALTRAELDKLRSS